MKSYPSIELALPYQTKLSEIPHRKFILFDKIDGSNIRVEWNPDRGFYKFGTRKAMLGEDHPLLGSAVQLIRAKYETAIQDVMALKSSRYLQPHKGLVLFFEFWGPKSFAGWHDATDQHHVTLLDVAAHGMPLLGPQEFLDTFGFLDTPKVLGRQYLTEELVLAVRGGTLEGMGLEGIVAKSEPDKKQLGPLLVKIKRQDWIDRVKSIPEWEKKDLI